jgi:4-hydroxybenzoate polyprenyltransferase
MELIRSTRVTLEMIKWEHSIFALPFALCGAMLAAGGLPNLHQLAWIVVAMVAARSAAMAFNRLVDHQIDAANPRTRMRALPVGLLTRRFVVGFTLVSCALFFLAASQLNHLALMLSPVALAVLLSYSFTKRFTRWSHLVLGLSLGIAPAAAWIAVCGTLDPRIIVLTLVVIFWVAGFDVLYACQDYEFDRGAGLHSVPRYLGIPKALWMARVFHIVTLGLLVWVAMLFGLGLCAWAGLAIVGLLLLYEHTLVKATDLSKLNAAFFTMNGVISVLFFVAVAVDLLVHRR